MVNSEVAADLEHAQQIEHPIVVSIRTGWNRMTPEGLDKFFPVLTSRGKTGDSVHCHEARAMITSEFLSFQGVLVAIRIDTLGTEEIKQTVRLCNGPGVFGKPLVVHGDVHGYTPRVKPKIIVAAKPTDDGPTIELRIVGRQSR